MNNLKTAYNEYHLAQWSMFNYYVPYINGYAILHNGDKIATFATYAEASKHLNADVTVAPIVKAVVNNGIYHIIGTIDGATITSVFFKTMSAVNLETIIFGEDYERK